MEKRPVAAVTRPAVAALPRLSRRELDVLVLLGRGYRMAGIARELGIRVPTVQTYCRRLRTKLNADSHRQLRQIAILFLVLDKGPVAGAVKTVPLPDETGLGA